MSWLAVAVLLIFGAPGSWSPREAVCARTLGISWSVENGATEQLEAFARCVR